MNELKFDELSIGMNIIDSEGIEGEIEFCDDIHNIIVRYPNIGTSIGIGIFCLDSNCAEYEPIFSIE